MPPELIADQGYSRAKKGNLFNKHYSRWQLLNNLPPISSLWKRVKNPIITHSWGGRHRACSYWGRLVIRQSQLFGKIISLKICLNGKVRTRQLLLQDTPSWAHGDVHCRLELGGCLGGPSRWEMRLVENPNNFVCVLLPICLGPFAHFRLLEKVYPYARTPNF